MCVGDTIELLTPGKVGVSFVVNELYDKDGNPISSTPHPYMEFYMKVPFEVKAGDIIRAG